MRNFEYIGTELELFSKAINWKHYWSLKILESIHGDVLEVGAGIGSVTKLFEKYASSFNSWLAIEPDETQFQNLLELKNSQNLDEKVSISCGDLSHLPADIFFDTILYIDVLEHIEKDSFELENAFLRLNKGGSIVVLSPAHNFLFSNFDKSIGHFRRYNKSSIISICPKKAYIRDIFYLDSVGFVASFCNKFFLKSPMPTSNQIQFWDKYLVRCSMMVDKLINFIFGKTIICIICKR